MFRYAPHEDEVLLPYVDKMARWDEVLPRLPGRTPTSAATRLVKLRRKAGTVWTIDQKNRQRVQGRFV